MKSQSRLKDEDGICIERHCTIFSMGPRDADYVVEVQVTADDDWDDSGTIFGNNINDGICRCWRGSR